jgi:DNA-binding CsgD family transcriptional regulator/PAS domain-containing protein
LRFNLVPAQEQELSQLLLTLYACPTSPALWPKFLKEFADFLDLPAIAILRGNGEARESMIQISTGLDPASEHSYAEYYHTIDEYRSRFLRQPKDEGLVFAEEFCPMQALRRTEFFNDFLAPQDTALYGVVLLSRTATIFENISLYYQLQKGPPNDETLQRLHLVLPHVQSALNTQRRLVEAASKTTELAEALHFLRTGLVLLDEKGKCVFVNSAAERQLKEADGLYLRDSFLYAFSRSESTRLRELIRRVTTRDDQHDFSHGGALLVSRREGKPLQLLVSRFSAGNLQLPRRAFAIVLICDPEDRPIPPAELLSGLYRLTPAESRLAMSLGEGRELRRACHEASITYATGRAHLRSIFCKTGVRRQSELISLFLGIACPFNSALPKPR